jgi:uncharacterized membrane protein
VSWRLAALALVFAWFLLGGIGHFVLADAFTSVVPPYVPYPRLVVLATGAFEIAGALALLHGAWRVRVGWALMAFTICVTPVHIDMLINADRHTIGAPALWARLLFQPVYVWIIWFATRPRRAA